MKEKELDKVKTEMVKKEKSLYDELEVVRRSENDRVSSILNSLKSRQSEKTLDQDNSVELSNLQS